MKTPEHAGQLARGARVDPDDPGMGDRAAHERGMEHAGQRDVVDEPSGAAQEPRVFDARDVGADVLSRTRSGLEVSDAHRAHLPPTRPVAVRRLSAAACTDLTIPT